MIKELFYLFRISHLFRKAELLHNLRLIISFLAIYFFLIPDKALATHISGASITYRWVTGNTFELHLTLYRDCSGIAAPNSVSVNCNSLSCGYTINLMLNRIANTGQEITRPCDTASTNCSSGNNPGIQKFEYTADITLPGHCTDWVFGYNICCRNCAITTISYTPNNCAGVPGTYVEARLNNFNAPANSSPVFTNDPVYFYCIGQPVQYNMGAIDADGDSLVYSLVNPQSSPVNSLVFNPGYSVTNPISSSPPVSVSQTGDIKLNPTAPEVGVMAIRIDEYRNGIFIGSVVQDIEMWTSNCSNNLPTLTGINGTSSFQTVVCPGTPINFTINSNDANTGQVLSMAWNNGIPGATFSATTDTFPTGTFSWTPTVANIRSQPYVFTVTVMDNNCPMKGFQTYSYSITVAGLSATLNAVNSACPLPGTGSITAFASGTGPFQYSWSTGATGTSSITGLSAGTYSVTITDANGCSISSNSTVTAPAPLNISLLTANQILCNDDDNGLISVISSGGTNPHTYVWSNGATGPVITNLYSGNYSVTVTDNAGCTNSFSYSLIQPPVLSATTAVTPVQCFGESNGGAAVIPTGGVGTYSYAWSNGDTASSISGLIQGTYSVVVNDDNGCTVNRIVNVTQPSAINIDHTSSDAFCGLFNGSISASVTGGTGPYSYNWDPGNLTTSDISGLDAGLYILTVTDATGCAQSKSIPISNTTGPLINLSSLANVTCKGGSDGAVSVTVSGGQAPYSYQWFPSVGSGPSINGLSTGSYTLLVTDANNCSSSISVFISEPAVLSSSFITVNPNCGNASNGSALVSVNGGTPPYNYNWLPGNINSPTLNNMSLGHYSVTITDANGCLTADTLDITSPLPIVGNVISSTPVSCFGENNGSAGVSVTGGLPPYRFNWSGTGDTLAFASGLASGLYNITVTDASNCTEVIPVSVTQPAPLISSINSFRNVSCQVNNGFAQATANGGNSVYSYMWSPNGDTTASINNLTPGLYSVTVTDDKGCSSASSVNIIQTAFLTLSLASFEDVSCKGGNDGSAIVSATGGLPPYTYQWLPTGGNSSIAGNLSAWNYLVTVTDAGNCSSSINILISEPDSLNFSVTAFDATCFNGNDGSATVNVAGGIPPYIYSWNPGGGNSSIEVGLSAGNHSIKVSDSKGCSQTKPFNIVQPAMINLNMATTSSACGASLGSLNVSATGGNPGYSYLWSPINSTDSIITNLPAGVYTVTAEDANGCTASGTTVIINSTSPSVTAGTVVPVSCFGGNDGSASLNISGGTGPFTYQWSPYGGTGTSASGLSAGNYSVTITDGFNCLSYFSVTISQPQPLSATLTTTPPGCFGGNNGIARVNTTGGTTPYAYSWSNGTFGTDSVRGLSAGNISVVITDQKGCIDSSQGIISQPTALMASINNSTPVSCNGGYDGSASTLISGGTAPYTYNWNPTGKSTSAAAGLSAGNYLVTVSDAFGCTASTGISITEPQPLTLQTSTQAGSCSLPNGSASVIVSGGIPPYNYLWNASGQTSSVINGLNPGVYSVTVNDINNCSATTTATILNTGIINISLLSETPVTCYGGNDGTALLNVNNGLPPYTFNWQPTGGNSAFANGLIAGVYHVTVSDAANCTQSLNVIITEPPPLTVQLNISNITCFRAGNGSAVVIASGGTGAFNYQWQPGGLNSPVIGNLQAGNYSIEVTDINGCTITAPVTITEPSPLVVTTATTPAGCLLHNGTASAMVNGGTTPYSYLWNPGIISGSTANGIPAGSYIVNITDSNNCSVTAAASVSNTTGPTLSLLTATPVSCYNGNNGTASINTLGGIPPFEYNWFPYGGHGTTAVNLIAGSYSVTVRDSNNCLTSLPVTISQPNPLSSLVTTSDVKCFGFSDGAVYAATSGGTAPFSYVWSTGDTSSSISNLPSGNYLLTTTDGNGCMDSVQALIGSPEVLSVSTQQSDVTCNGFNNGAASVIVSGGTPGFNYIWSNGSTSSTANNLFAGIYLISVRDTNGCRVDSLITIHQPQPLIVNITSNDASCKGKPDGNATAIVSGGNPPYSYQWLPNGGSSDHAENLAEGAYSIVVTDGNQCTSGPGFQIGAPPALSLRKTTKDATCSGKADGFAEITVSGGVAPYTYFWTTGSDSASTKNLFAGNYSAQVTDKNSCTISSTLNINQPPPLLLSMDNPPSICIGQQAELILQCNGGTPGYIYKWNNGINGSHLFVAPTQTTLYYANAFDTNGCVSNTAVAVVRVNDPLTLQAGLPDTVCKGSSALLTVSAAGGNEGPYSFLWNTGDTTDRIKVTPDSTTSYSVTVSDACGSPPYTLSMNVVVSRPPEVDFIADTISGCQPLEINFTDLTYSNSNDYYWNFGDGNTDILKNPSHTYLYPGNYSVNHIVKDNNGCIGKKVIPSLISVFPQSIASFTEMPETASIFNPVISFFDQSTNSNAWEWDFGDGSEISKSKNIEHAYRDTGIFIVKLISISDKNCKDTAYGMVTIKDEFAFYIPNAFTPNGDEVNEVFAPLGIGVKEFDMLIFDRWGLEIFNSSDILKGWNGKKTGSDAACPTDVYVYRIKVTDLQGRVHDYFGRVNLVR